MHRIWISQVLTGSVLLTGLIATGQTVTEEHKMYLLGPNDTLAELSLQTGTVKSTTSKTVVILGAGKSKTYTEFPGTSAPVRLRSGAPQAFILGTGSGFTLPEGSSLPSVYATLVKLEANKKDGTRELLSSSFAGYAGIGKTRTADGVIPLNFSRFSDHAIRIEPRATLAPGEYGFLAVVARDPYATANQILYYCFGID
jgi:hypothetical protein